MIISTRKLLDPKFFNSITDCVKYNYLSNAPLPTIEDSILHNGILPIRDGIKYDPDDGTKGWLLAIHAATFKAAYGLNNNVLLYNRYYGKGAPFSATYVGFLMINDTTAVIVVYNSISDFKANRYVAQVNTNLGADGYFKPDFTNNCYQQFNMAGVIIGAN